jgi:hypothetical protein
MTTSAAGDLDALLALARAELPPESIGPLEALESRRRDPVRVAIAGRVKAGKSTLLNALVGERLAPTGLGERTKLVATYRWGHAPEVRMVRVGDPDDGGTPLPFRRVEGALDIDIPDPPPDGLRHLSIRWPAPALRNRILIDTPGLGAHDGEAEARTRTFLGTEGGATGGADAVIYLMRNRHRDDLAFLEAFGETGLARPSPVTAIGVLSRADEVGGGDLDADAVARRVAAGFADERVLRPLCQTVVPLCGLLAETALTLSDAEARALIHLAGISSSEREIALRSVDDFRDPHRAVGLSEPEREVLLQRLGLFGLRRSCELVDAGHTTPTALADALRHTSGIDDLGLLIDRVFGARSELLTTRSIVTGLAQLAAAQASAPLAEAVERFTAARHEWRELEVLVALRGGQIPLGPDSTADAERILGGDGNAPTNRLGLPAAATTTEVLGSITAALDRWHRRAAQPLAPPAVAATAEAVIRSLEGLAAASD